MPSCWAPPLAASISSTPARLAAYTGDVTRWVVALVAIPLMVIAAVATHFTARTSVARQRGLPDGAQQAAIMNTLALWVFRSACSSAGASCRWRILAYWLSSNVWTLAQQRYVHRLPDRHDAAGVARAINAPPRPVVDPPEDRR